MTEKIDFSSYIDDHRLPPNIGGDIVVWICNLALAAYLPTLLCLNSR
jgi:hypothetical protein